MKTNLNSSSPTTTSRTRLLPGILLAMLAATALVGCDEQEQSEPEPESNGWCDIFNCEDVSERIVSTTELSNVLGTSEQTVIRLLNEQGFESHDDPGRYYQLTLEDVDSLAMSEY
jgi:biotin operon repressor